MLSVEEYIKVLLDDPFNKQLAMIDQYDARFNKFQQERPTELSEFKLHLNKLANFKAALEKLKFNLNLDVILAVITDEMTKEQEQWLTDKEKAFEKVDVEIDALRIKIESDNKKHNECLVNQNNSSNVGYTELEEKRKTLESYSDKIFNMCNQYDISLTDVNIDESMFTTDELSKLYDEYIKFMQKESKGTNVIAKFRNVCSEPMIQGVALLGLLFLCFTQILDFVSLGFFIALGVNQIQNANRAKYYSILLAITFNIKPENMGYTALDESQLLPEELTDDMLDDDPRFDKFDEMYDKVESMYEDSNPEKEHAKYMVEWSNALQENRKHLEECERIYTNKIGRIIADVDSEINYCIKERDKLMAEFKFLGERFSEHLTFSGKYTLGLHDDCIEEKVDVGQKNIIIRPSRDVTLMNKFLQCLCVNVYGNVLPGKVKIICYDPNDFGRSIMPLFTKEMKDILEFYNDRLESILDELVTYVQENFKIMSGKTIDEYNSHCEEVGITPIEYRVLMLLSQPKTVEEDEKLSSFFEYSSTGGVFIWMVSDSMQSRNAFVFRKPFEGVQNPIVDIVTDEWCAKCRDNLIYAIEKAKPKGLEWKTFVENVIPEDKIWTGVSNKEIEMYPGYKNGDPTSFKPFGIGNTGNVHVLGVGGTGAGKSVFLNHMVCTLTRQYSPKELELWLCDFKGSEFISYLNTESHPWMLPHIKACLCTSDGDYATSLFHALRAEADLRYDIMKTPMEFLSGNDKGHIPYYPGNGYQIINKKDTESWNKMWEKEASDKDEPKFLANRWPRIIFICDEFQVIFEKADSKNLESIKADITQIAKVGRAANVHIFFTSQSMNKTLSADILQQFTLRFALRCDKAVSTEILGTTKASDIKEKFGWLIVKATGISNEDQARYKTPFFPEKDGYSEMFYNHIKEMQERAIKENMPKKDVITYLESTKHPIEQLEATYKDPNIVSKLPASGVFFLGNRMAYSANKAPDNIILTAKNNTNIMSVCSDFNDYVMFFQELMVNIKCNREPGTVIINTQIHDIGYLCDIDKYVTFPDKHGRLAWENVSCKEFILWCEKLVAARKQQNNKEKPVWIFLLGWDKGSGVGVEPDVTLRGKINVLLQTAGEFNVHFIFINTCMTGIAFTLVNACNYRIAAKCSQDDSISCIGTKQAGINYDGMKTGWIFSWHDATVTRDKLYVSPVEREIQSSEIVL